MPKPVTRESVVQLLTEHGVKVSAKPSNIAFSEGVYHEFSGTIKPGQDPATIQARWSNLLKSKFGLQESSMAFGCSEGGSLWILIEKQALAS
jgi:hypothetical protein